MRKPKVDPSAPRNVTVPIGTPTLSKRWATPYIEITPECKLDLDCSLKDIILFLSEVQEKYEGTYESMYIDSASEYDYGDTTPHVYYYIAGTRLETQLEVDFRLSKENKLKEQKDKEERKEYERLKKKFGDVKEEKK